MDGQEYVETTLNFASPDLRGFRAPGGYTQQHGRLQSGEPMRSGQQKVKLWNARLLDPAPTLETHGFQLIAHEPIQWDLKDMSVVRNEFYPWCRELIRKVTGCAEVRGGSNEFRRPAGLPTPNGSGGGYATGIHSDMSPGIELGWQPGDDDRHFESINVWRTAESEFDIEMMPLALCAIETMATADIVFGDGQVSMPCNIPYANYLLMIANNHRYGDAQNTGDVRMYFKLVDERCCYSPAQRWYYFPRITPTETLIFRQYDTREEALNRRTVFHTAAEDPTSPPSAHDRYTIEVRMQAVYGHEGNEAKVARIKRWKDGIISIYPDGTESNWFSGREFRALCHGCNQQQCVVKLRLHCLCGSQRSKTTFHPKTSTKD